MNISVVGSGFVGLITAVGLASKGNKVVCIDIDQTKVDMINRSEPPFYQHRLAEELHTQVKTRSSLRASTDYDDLLQSEVTIICVNTSSNEGISTDFGPVQGSAKAIGETLRKKQGYHLVANKSSVLPGTTETVVIPTLEEHSGKRAGQDLGVAVNPEFLQEGKALHGFLRADRIVIGQHDQMSGDLMQQVYNGFRSPVLRTNLKTAEMIKFASNAFLATKISFINEIGNLCKKLDVDVYDVADGMGYDPRIGRAFLNAGIGFGGGCLPKDLGALIDSFDKTGETPTLLRAVYQANRNQPQKMIQIARERMGGLRGKRIGILGLAFKPETDDIRNAPALELIQLLLDEGARVIAYDPRTMPRTLETQHEGLAFGDSTEHTIAQSDCVLIVTEWNEFKDESMYSGKVVIDGRRALDPKKARLVCQHYEGVCW
jgi:UDPglucose 6-dehydrogenase